MIDTPKEYDKESEYFARQEFERRKKMEEERSQELEKDARAKLKELHHMRCPKCGMQLIELDYKNLKIDKCSECDGIWLDAGELEEIAKDNSGQFSGFLKMFGG